MKVYRFGLVVLVFAVESLVGPSAATAMPITGYAIGQVTQDYYARDFNANTRSFLIGEPVYVTFTYDLTPDIPGNPFAPPRGSIRIQTGTGFDSIMATGNARSQISGQGDFVRIYL